MMESYVLVNIVENDFVQGNLFQIFHDLQKEEA